MRASWMVPLLLAPLAFGLTTLAIGCDSTDDGSTFGGGGSSNTGDGGSDTGGDGGAVDPSAPVITDVSAEFYNPPNLPTVIEVFIFWEDLEGDVDGGQIHLEVDASDGESLSETLDIDGKFARIDEDEDGTPVTFWLSGTDNNAIDTSLTYTVELTLEDVAGNESAATTVDVN